MYSLIISLIIFILIVVFICDKSQIIKPNILTAIVCIDRDNDLAEKLYTALINNNVNDILIVTRKSDTNTINFWKNKALIKTVPHYDITDRHNLNKLAEKRSIVLNYAKNKYDAVWFVDSDVIPLAGTLNELSKTDKDICYAPYKLKREGDICVGIKSDSPPYVKLHKIRFIDKLLKSRPCIIAGLGCTYIKSTAFDQKIECKKIEDSNHEFYGEDIGFFMNCWKAGLTCEYLTRWEQPHLFKK